MNNIHDYEFNNNSNNERLFGSLITIQLTLSLQIYLCKFTPDISNINTMYVCVCALSMYSKYTIQICKFVYSYLNAMHKLKNISTSL